MNSSLLQDNQRCLELGSLFNSNMSLNEDVNLLENSEEEKSYSFPITNQLNDENNLFCVQSPFEFPNSEDKFNSSSRNNEVHEKDNETYSQFNSINNINENCMNINPISILTTSNSFSLVNIGVKNEEISLKEKFRGKKGVQNYA